MKHCEDELCWVRFCGGAFEMGRADGEEDERPVHVVVLPPFEILQTEVTVAAYRRCVDAGACAAEGAPVSDPSQCHLDMAGYDAHPMNCADAAMAADFCAFVGARLPSEAEWEYAARGAGGDILYPWGNAEPSCDLVVVNECLGALRETREACSVPGGNSRQGLCDMAGNAIEWVADAYHVTYEDAPLDGSAWVVPGSEYQVMRGGGVGCAETLDVYNRVFHAPDFWYAGMGFRCGR